MPKPVLEFYIISIPKVSYMTNERREQLYRTEALVIGRFDLGETDRILTIFTPKHGKFRAIAKGIRRPMSRLAAHLELYNQSRLMLAKGRELDVITGAETIDGHWQLRSDLDSFGAVSYLWELGKQLTDERGEQPPLFAIVARP